jgi:hypothetical protein
VVWVFDRASFAAVFATAFDTAFAKAKTKRAGGGFSPRWPVLAEIDPRA